MSSRREPQLARRRVGGFEAGFFQGITDEQLLAAGLRVVREKPSS